MRYLGSKASTLSALQSLVAENVDKPGTFCDPFGGVAVVGAHFRKLGWTVYSCDLLHCAHHFQVARIMLDEPPITDDITRETGARTPQEFVEYLESLEPVSSWVHREFALRRGFFTVENAMRIDAARIELERLRSTDVMRGATAAYYSACLVDAVDYVANTAGTYYAYLKGWNRKALRKFTLRLIEPASGPVGWTGLADANWLVRQRHWDVLYLDPPHNDRDYAAYYHLPETLATGRQPSPRGRSGVDAAPRPRSAFASPRTAADAIENLLSVAQFKILLLHYTDTGLISPDQLRRELGRYGQINEYVISAVGYGTKGSRIVNHRLYLVQP